MINKITDNKFFIAVMIFFLIVPAGMQMSIEKILPMTPIRFFFYFIILLKSIPYYLKNKKISIMTIVSIIYCFGRFIVTYINSRNFLLSFTSYALFTIVILSIYIETNVQTNYKNIFNGLMIYCETITYINLLSFYIPSLSKLFYVGHIFQNDNNHFVYYALGLTISSIFYYINKDKVSLIRLIILWTIIVISTIKAWSATCVVAIFVFFIVLLLSLKLKICNIVTYIATYLASFIGIVMFNVQYLFSFIIVDILHKDPTLTLRTYVWDHYKNVIAKSPIIGYGYNAIDLYDERQKKSLYAHNHVLQEIYNGGIIMYLVYIWFVIFPAIKLWKNRDNKLSKVLSAIIFSILVHGLCESLSTVIYAFIFCLIYYVDFYINIRKGNNNE